MVWSNVYTSLVLAAAYSAAQSDCSIQVVLVKHTRVRHERWRMGMNMDVFEAAANVSAQSLGYMTLKQKQKDIILNILTGKYFSAVLPTGYGKSLCLCQLYMLAKSFSVT